MDRHHSRILAMQALCQWEVLGEAFYAQLDEFLHEESPPSDVAAYARSLVEDATTKVEAVDRQIQEAALHWELRRIAPVDRCILRIAVCELLYRPDMPPRVVVSEAIELGKTFGTAESGSFINGVLDAILKKLKMTSLSGAGAGDGTV